MACVRTRRVVALVLAAGAVVAGAVLLLPGHGLAVDPVADADVARSAASSQRADTARSGRLTGAQTRVMHEVPGAHRSGTTVVVPLVASAGAEGFERVAVGELVGAALPLDVHAYTRPWDWSGSVPPAAPALQRPAPGAVVGDLGPAYLGCRALSGVPGCTVVTLLRDGARRWLLLDSWYVRWMGVDRWPDSPATDVQVRTYPDLSGTTPLYLVAGAVAGTAGSVRLRTDAGDVESAGPDASRLAAGFWTFHAVLPALPEAVTTYDARGRRGPTWGVHEAEP